VQYATFAAQFVAVSAQPGITAVVEAPNGNVEEPTGHFPQVNGHDAAVMFNVAGLLQRPAAAIALQFAILSVQTPPPPPHRAQVCGQ